MINLSEEIFVAYDSIPNGKNAPNSTIVPFSNKSSEKQKIQRLDSKPKKEIFKNRPLPGFAIGKNTYASWSTKEVLWQIVDPRGFSISIDSGNLNKIIQNTAISEGVITEKCVWARHGLNVILLPINAPEYKEALENTEILSERIYVKDLKPGDE